MKTSTLVAAGFLASSGMLWMMPLMMSSWRIGAGSWFLKDQAGVGDFLTFPYKYYGPFSVTGSYRSSWTTLSRSTCDAFMVAFGLSAVEGLVKENDEGDLALSADEGGFCVAEPNEAHTAKWQDSIQVRKDDGNACPDTFAYHFEQRCFWYRQIKTIGTVMMSLCSLAFMMNMGCVMCIFLTKLTSTRETIFASLIFCQILLWIAFGMWVGVSGAMFTELGQSGAFPYPSLGWAAYFYVGAVCWHLIGTCLFGYFKIFQKWISGQTEDPHLIEYQQQRMAMNQMPGGAHPNLQGGPGMAPMGKGKGGKGFGGPQGKGGKGYGPLQGGKGYGGGGQPPPPQGDYDGGYPAQQGGMPPPPAYDPSQHSGGMMAPPPTQVGAGGYGAPGAYDGGQGAPGAYGGGGYEQPNKYDDRPYAAPGAYNLNANADVMMDQPGAPPPGQY